MKKPVFFVFLLFLAVISNAQVLFNTGNAELDADLEKINVDAKLDFRAFKTDINMSYNIS